MPVGSILVYVTSDVDNALGENVLKLPLLLALSAGFPTAKIAWVPGTSGEFYLRRSLAPLVDGRIAEFITDLDIPVDPRAAIRAKHPILKRRFDLIIDTQRYLGRTLFLRRIPHRRFISGTWRYLFSNARPPRGLPVRPPRLTDKLLGLAAAAAGHEIPVSNPIPLPPALRARAAALLPAGPTYVALAPGAGVKHTGKCWPLDSFIALARQQVERGRVPLFFVGPAELDWCERLRWAVPEALFPEQAAHSTAYRAFTLADALVGGDAGEAMRSYLRLRTQGERLSGLVYLMAQRLRDAEGVSVRIKAGEAPAEIKRNLRMPPRAADRFIADVARTEPERLRVALCRIADLELDTRGGPELSESRTSLSSLDEDTLAMRAILAVAG